MGGLLILGAGGHGKVAADTALEMQAWDRLAFLDDRFPELNSVQELPVLGKFEQAEDFREIYSDIIIALGNNRLRMEMLQRFQKMGFTIRILIHPTAFVSRNARLEPGTVVFPNAVINTGTVVKAGGIVNSGAIVEHDCILEEGVHISPGASLAGNVKVGTLSWIGINATIIQGLTIGANVMVGAGTVIINSIPDGVTVVGVPGKVIKVHG